MSHSPSLIGPFWQRHSLAVRVVLLGLTPVLAAAGSLANHTVESDRLCSREISRPSGADSCFIAQSTPCPPFDCTGDVRTVPVPTVVPDAGSYPVISAGNRSVRLDGRLLPVNALHTASDEELTHPTTRLQNTIQAFAAVIAVIHSA
jgi:hypothetical protein